MTLSEIRTALTNSEISFATAIRQTNALIAQGAVSEGDVDREFQGFMVEGTSFLAVLKNKSLQTDEYEQ